MADRRFIIRFRNEEDINTFASKIGTKLNYKMIEVYYPTMKKKGKQSGKSSGKDERWKETWTEMPEYIQDDVKEYSRMTFYVQEAFLEDFTKHLDQDITESSLSVWYPKYQTVKGDKFLLGGEKTNTPIYVISKGRSGIKMTSHYLSIMEQSHYIVVEPQEVQKYNLTLGQSDYCTVLELDLDYKLNYDACDDLGNTMSKGSGGARNFCWDHSIKNGHKWHWLMDDNIDGFFYLNRNKQIKVRTSAIFKIVEDFTKRYDNVGMSGLQYSSFCVQTSHYPPYGLNKRIFSCILINNEVPFRWKGRFNEDVILSLNILKEGYGTILINQFMIEKSTTQKVKGGNTEELYGKGTKQKSQMLVNLFPDIARHSYRFSRDHHYVDYSMFKDNKITLKDEFKNLEDKVDNKGLYIVKLDDEETNLNRSTLEDKYNKANITLEEVYNNDYYQEKEEDLLLKETLNLF